MFLMKGTCCQFSFSQMTSDYDKLSLLQKVEVFEHGLNNTNGDDLAKVLWLKSPNSEVSGGRGVPTVLCDICLSTDCSAPRCGSTGEPTTQGHWQSCRWWDMYWGSETDTPPISCWTEPLDMLCTSTLETALK